MSGYNFKAGHLRKSDGSHLPLLVKLVVNTDGPILELGTGFFSTPVLHWLCAPTKRKMVSYESSPGFIEVANNFKTDFHDVRLITDWDTLDLSEHWNIIFIDHAPGPRRNVEMQRVVDCADYVVVHDTEARSNWHYNFSKGFHLYKYRYDYRKVYPETSILSNSKDLSNVEQWLGL